MVSANQITALGKSTHDRLTSKHKFENPPKESSNRVSKKILPTSVSGTLNPVEYEGEKRFS